jgi:hypothetical protein
MQTEDGFGARGNGEDFFACTHWRTRHNRRASDGVDQRGAKFLLQSAQELVRLMPFKNLAPWTKFEIFRHR